MNPAHHYFKQLKAHLQTLIPPGADVTKMYAREFEYVYKQQRHLAPIPEEWQTVFGA